LQATLIVPLAALGFSLHQQAQYQASAQVLLQQQDLSNSLNGVATSNNTPADRAAQTQANLARVPNVAQRAIEASGVPMTASALLASSSVATATNSDLLTFDVTNHSPALAARLATAYARAYVGYRLESDTAPIKAALAEVEQQIATVPKSGALLANLEAKATQLRTIAALKTANATLVRAAGTAQQTAPKTTRNVMLGLILGLFLGIGLAFLREALDTRVRSAEAIGEQLQLPLLARLPQPSKKLRAENRLVMLADPSSVHAESVRMLRTNVEFASLGKKAKVIMVTSATEQEGKSTTISNLGIALARSGKHVVLVDLDLRRPFVDKFFDLGDRPGITQVAIGAVSLDEAITRIPIVGRDSHARPATTRNGNGNGFASQSVGTLDVLLAGPIPPDPGEFVGTARLASLLEHVAANADVVLVDAPPLLHVGDGLVLSSRVDAVIVITRMDVMRRPMLTELKRLLDAMPANKLGFVVTGAESEESYGGYGYGGRYYVRPYERQQKLETSA
jgi:Mrp family chromosome partitioning ATPase/capsular polysaccharide biosynthesis protein